MKHRPSLIDSLTKEQAERLDEPTAFEIRALEQRMPIIDKKSCEGWVYEISEKLRRAVGRNNEYSQTLRWYEQQGFFKNER